MNLSKVMQWHRFRSPFIQSYRCLCDKKDKPITPPPAATNLSSVRPTYDSPKPIHPFTRTLNMLKNDMKTAKNFILPKKKKIIQHTNVDDDFSHKNINVEQTGEFQTHCDVLIIGGGGVGSSIAFWLKKRGMHGINVVVAEKDCTVFHLFFI